MLTLFSAQAWSESWFKDANIYARMGYSIGGTAPLDMPATIRKLNRCHSQKLSHGDYTWWRNARRPVYR